jgi:uncharacterized protein YbjQ (UPF0145 family)
MPKLAACTAAALALAGCSALSHQRKADEKPIEIIASGAPTKPFMKIGRIDFHVEKWASKDAPSMDEFRPDLLEQARLAGADAVMDVEWELKGTAETGVYHVTATAISYRVPREPATPRPAPQGAQKTAPGDVEILTDAPARPFKKVSSLELYVEKKGKGEPSFEDVLPELKRQARLSGAQAVVNVEWNVGGPADAPVYHVTATGISYTAPEASAGPTGAPAK